jgi:hypothetical protein
MLGLLVNLIIQLVAGAIGGNAVAATAKNADLGAIANSVVGAIGGGAGGQLPVLAAIWMSALAAPGSKATRDRAQRHHSSLVRIKRLSSDPTLGPSRLNSGGDYVLSGLTGDHHCLPEWGARTTTGVPILTRL